jgi:hypothetical protein
MRNRQFQAIMVLAHMNYRDDLVAVSINRHSWCGDGRTGQFINGHFCDVALKRSTKDTVSFDSPRFGWFCGFQQHQQHDQ